MKQIKSWVRNNRPDEESRQHEPCPFCGGAGVLDDDGEDCAFWVLCFECNAEGPTAATAEGAWGYWDQRKGQ